MITSLSIFIGDQQIMAQQRGLFCHIVYDYMHIYANIILGINNIFGNGTRKDS